VLRVRGEMDVISYVVAEASVLRLLLSTRSADANLFGVARFDVNNADDENTTTPANDPCSVTSMHVLFSAVQCSTVQYSRVQCSTVLCTVQCSTVQCSTVL